MYFINNYKMLSVYIQGGLGNQLFQIFALIYVSLEHKIPFTIPYYEITSVGNKRPTYWKTFLKHLARYTFTTNNYGFVKYNEPSFNYNKLPAIASKHIMYFGYFQSEKYFKPMFQQICKLIKIDEFKQSVKSEFGDTYLRSNVINVSMHFRLGDYKFLQNVHPVIDDAYYVNSLNHIVLKVENIPINVICFCEEEDKQVVLSRIKHIESQFESKQINFILCDSQIEDWKQMIFMSLCDHNIIANSTFSWWGAYLNSSVSKMVTYPSKWFGLANKHIDIVDLIPNDWIKI